jgi:hypothetical protein
LLILLIFAACAPEPTAPSAVGVVAPVLTFEAAPVSERTAYATTPPLACPEPIYAAQPGNSTDVPVLADPHTDVLGAAPTPFQLHVGWTGDTATTMSMIWRTDADTYATQVQLGLDDSYGTTLDGASFLLGVDSTDGRVHEVHVCGLTPSTTWHYRVGAEGAWSADASFTTGPAIGSTDPIVFGVAGDSRGSPSTWGEVLLGEAAHAIDFRLFTGDAVLSGSRVSDWDGWYDAGRGFIEGVPTMAAHGNHEGLAKPYFALAALPGNERYYSFDYGNVHFVALNDTVPNSAEWSTEALWLAADLAATTQPWKIVYHHKPAYTSCAPNGTDANVLTWFVPVEEAGGVHLDLAGHNHNYERSIPLAAGVEATPETGITYVVTAGAGAPLYDNNQDNFYTFLYDEIQHYVVVEVDGDTLTLTAYDLAGNVIDTFTLTQ